MMKNIYLLQEKLDMGKILFTIPVIYCTTLSKREENNLRLPNRDTRTGFSAFPCQVANVFHVLRIGPRLLLLVLLPYSPRS
jgi:hypothetical protein